MAAPPYAFGPPRAANGYRPVPGRQVPSRTIYNGRELHPGSMPGVPAAIANVFTPGEAQHPGSVRAYGGEVARSFDPRTREGLTNIGMTLFPGGRLSAEQKAYLDQLQTHGVRPPRLGETKPVYGPRPWTGATFIPKSKVESEPELKALADVLGYTGGHPLPELLTRNTKTRVGIKDKAAYGSEWGTDFIAALQKMSGEAPRIRGYLKRSANKRRN
jgi:hypothetical protein